MTESEVAAVMVNVTLEDEYTPMAYICTPGRTLGSFLRIHRLFWLNTSIALDDQLKLVDDGRVALFWEL